MSRRRHRAVRTKYGSSRPHLASHSTGRRTHGKWATRSFSFLDTNEMNQSDPLGEGALNELPFSVAPRSRSVNCASGPTIDIYSSEIPAWGHQLRLVREETELSHEKLS
jgi:hypothetical protein